MTYNPLIPTASQIISASQVDLLNNFATLNTAWEVNHVDFNAANSGKHEFVEMPNQGADPAGALNEFTIFSKVATISELFYKRDNAGASFQLTGDDPVAATNGSTFLPGGLKLIWGSDAAVVTNTATNYAGGLSFNSACYVFIPIVTSATDLIPLAVQSCSATQFTIKFTAAGNVPISYIAVGL